jgi:hypothetical protein
MCNEPNKLDQNGVGDGSHIKGQSTLIAELAVQAWMNLPGDLPTHGCIDASPGYPPT